MSARPASGATRATVDAVVTNYNYASYVLEAVASLRAQTVAPGRVVVVDDGSTDDSLERLRALQDPALVVVPQRNQGQLAACRAGLAHSTADYVYFLDGDDVADPRLVERVVEAVGGSRPAKVQFRMQGVLADGVSELSVFPSWAPGYDAAAMRRDNDTLGFYVCPPTSGNVFSREALDRLDLASLPDRESIDGAVALAMPYLGEVACLDDVLARYRVHDLNKSGLASEEGPPGTASATSSSAATRGHDVARMTFEVDRFGQRWRWLTAALPDVVAPDPERTLFVTERRLMIAGLERPAGWHGGAVARHLRGLRRSDLPGRQRATFAVWALLMLWPHGGWRRRLVLQRRSAVGRSRLAALLVRVLSGGGSSRGSR